MNKSELSGAQKPAFAGTVALLCFFPFFITNGYFNITDSKFYCFCFLSALFLMLCLFSKVSHAQSLRPSKKYLSVLNYTDLYIGLFTLTAVLSTFSSRYFMSAFSGGNGRRLGLVTVLAVFMAYIFISKFHLLREKEFILFGISAIIMCAFSLLQFLGFDPLWLFEHADKYEVFKFISLLGNINIFASYICLAGPFAMYMYCKYENKAKGWLWYAVAFFSFIGVIISNSDSGYLGITAAFIILGIKFFSYKKGFFRFMNLFISFLLSGILLSFLDSLFAKQSRSFSFFGRLLTNPYISAFLLIGAIAFSLVFFAISKKWNPFPILSKIFAGGFICLVTLYLGIVFYFTVVSPDTSLGRLEMYLRIGPRWASDRGGIWKIVLDTFSQQSMAKKIIGTGPDTLALAIVDTLGVEAYNLVFFKFDNAHNDILQYLLTMGLWGAGSYILFVVSCIRSCRKSDSQIKKALLVAVAAFLVQSMFNINQSITTPLFFVFLALTQCKVPTESNRQHNI